MRFTALLVALFAGAFAVCPPNSIKSTTRSKCFTYVEEPLNFAGAQKHCQKLGGHLTSTADGMEAKTLLSMATKKTTSTKFWIGIIHTAAAGKTKVHKNIWLDGTPYNYTRWRLAVRCAASQCIAAQTSDGRWTTAKCDRKLPFICISDDTNCPVVTCPAAPTVTCPPIQPFTTPKPVTCPTVTCPTVTCPLAPTVTCPTIPQAIPPADKVCPNVTCPTTTCPAVPSVTCPNCPTVAPVTCPAVPTVTCPVCPTVPAVTVPTTTTDKCPDCPTVTCPTTTCKPCPPPSNAEACPLGWLYFPLTQFCYRVLTATPMNYTTAEAACVDLGAHLCSIHSAEENEFVMKIASCGMKYYYWTDSVWIGLGRDPVIRSKWIHTDGTPNDYNSTWLWGKPDDGGYNQNCVHILADKGLGDYQSWSDYQCNWLLRASVCKKPRS